MIDRPDRARDVVSALLEHPDDTDEFEGKVFEQNGDIWNESSSSLDGPTLRGDEAP